MIWHPVVDTPCALGESPFWHPQEQRLYWVDIEAHELKRCGAQGQDVQTWRVPSEPGCIAPARNAAGEPSPPAPSSSMRAACRRFWPSRPTSGKRRWREYRSLKSASISARCIGNPAASQASVPPTTDAMLR